MTEYVVLIVGNADRWWTTMSVEQRTAGYAEYERFGAELTQRGHKITGGAELHASGGVWSGLAGDGAGRLRTRRVHLRGVARGRAADLRDDVLLPGPGGPCAVPEPEADLAPGLDLAPDLDPATDLDPAIAEAV